MSKKAISFTDWLLGNSPKKKKAPAASKPTFQHQQQLTAVQKRKKEVEKELTDLILMEQELLKLKGGR